jgi:hypothetical protein
MGTAHPEVISVQYTKEVAQISYALSVRCRAGECLQTLVRDARALYRCAWAREKERASGRS